MSSVEAGQDLRVVVPAEAVEIGLHGRSRCYGLSIDRCSRAQGPAALRLGSGLSDVRSPTEFLPNSWPSSAGMSRSSCGTRFADTFIATFSATTPVTSWRSAETTADRTGHEHPAAAGLQVLHERLGALLDRRVGPQRAGQLLAGRREGGQRGLGVADHVGVDPGRVGAGHGDPAVRDLQPQRVAEPLERRPWPRSRRSCRAAR